ncbi:MULTISPECIES: M16 family metallopeptidase [Rhodanobacter]|uniref:M16 family metallopeptidase n=1 Tax=Rhodanobacter TaxID=75309 RepID=UPI00048A00FF|nr:MULTISPECIES: pitrilysin family protein [Rhodanobacter]KZC18463.1 peptidase M16 [Rhodanobacter denitrificans]UJJ50337.1 insulinase family protein [Rhodanobacter denitrificans]UJM93054.1 insulinase family protein [Rhodanobacter denitrificans]UJM96584.1 insulinase family protein [Rhodanobacter denitrificans]UJN20586.1 insulinase family protein [Rhodanobacter denitrificans]
MKHRVMQLAAAIALAFAAGTAAASGANDVTRATLDNGLRVVIVRDALAPVVTTEMNYLAGSDEVPAMFPGTAHAVEHMMFRGSPGLSKDQLAAIAANMGGAFNADTTQGVTQYYFVAPSQDLDVALHVQSLRMRGVDMDEAAWAKERGAIEQEVSRDLSNPSYKFYEQLQAQLFEGTPYAHTALGTRASFDKTTAAMLKSFHDTWYAPNNAILVIAGDVDPAATLAKVKGEFGNIARRALPARPAFAFKPVQAKTITLPTDSPYGSIYLGYRMPGTQSKDYAAGLVLGSALASQRAALFGMGMDGTALFGTFGANLMPQAGFGMAVGIFPKDGNPQPVLAKMQSILAEAASKGIDPVLVDAAKRKAIAELEFKKNSVDGLANAWSQALAFQGLDSPDAMKQAIEAVTPAAVNALARATFDPAHAVTAILTPESSGKPVAGKGFGGAESFASSPDKPVTLPDWAAQAFAKLELPRSTLKPMSTTLSNGIKLIVQPESISDTVEVFGKIKTNQDLQAGKDDEGVAQVLGGMFPYGTASMNRLQLQQALDAISARESAGSSFSLAVPSVHFAEGIALLADNELHPALLPQAFSVVQRQTARVVAGQLQSPAFLTQLGLGMALLPPNDPQLRYPTPKGVMRLTMFRVKHYYRQTFRPDMTIIVVVGKVDPAQAKQVVEQAFGAWKADGPKPDVDYAAVPANKPGQFNVPDASVSQDSVQMAQTIDVTRNDPARFALNIGNQVLGGGFYASRLYHDLRDTRGLVYTVGTRFDLDKHRSTYTVSFGADPDRVAAASAIVVQDLKQMQQTPVTDSELKRAKGILLRQIPLGESSFGAIGGQLLTLSVEDKPLDAMTIAGQHYLQLTAKDVQQAYAKHIRPDAFVTAVKGAAPKG